LNEYISQHEDIDGLIKLKKRMLSDLDFFSSLINNKYPIQKSHVSCTNLDSFEAIIDVLNEEKGIIGVRKVFTYNKKEEELERFEVDIVSRNGACWIKVKAMKPEAIQSIYYGNTSYGNKSILKAAEEMIACAKQHLINYRVPVCVIKFVKGVTNDIAEELEDLGIVVHGNIINFDEEDGEKINNETNPDIESITTFPVTNLVNLDVTTLIAYVAGVCNGEEMYEYSDPVLIKQAIEEREIKTLPILDDFMRGKELIVTTTAYNKFQNIVNVVGGPKEIERSKELFKRITVVEDQPSERCKKLIKIPKVTEQHVQIFGTGDFLKATTMTANSTLHRVAKHNGIDLCVFIHPARALTEQKIINDENL